MLEIDESQLDQFYTNPIIADELVLIVKEMLPIQFEYNFLEPSAGTGNFLNALQKQHVATSRIQAYDLAPKRSDIMQKDYLKLENTFSAQRMVIGNPPFGKRGKLALQFLNKSLQEAPFVAMIFPNIFNRYSCQKQINPQAMLIYKKQLQENAFIRHDREYKVKCVFQIWTTDLTYLNDLRIKTPPQIKHPDFTTWIHNNTQSTLKYFNKTQYKWDFAVYRQGYYDYNLKITDPTCLVHNRQYFFVKANNKQALQLIHKIDFSKLSQLNTQVWGFSTSDFVAEYKRLKGEK